MSAFLQKEPLSKEDEYHIALTKIASAFCNMQLTDAQVLSVAVTAMPQSIIEELKLKLYEKQEG